ncbi:malignant T-cell-amplified sequence 1 homolog [Durio zibethinus]|uniref:Malignant T-cell-amplified sequence 1 homolog n=1 Tax=Durio zibethinus TaxID=66656 RepID=A0A6P5Z1H4_DURZI|nr:malignant T-cell-amplified sequence 1 homolog [Durio zibethinus]
MTIQEYWLNKKIKKSYFSKHDNLSIFHKFLLFGRFSSEDVSSQNQVKASVQRQIRQSIAEEDLSLQNHLNLVLLNSVALFLNIRDGPYMPTLQLLPPISCQLKRSLVFLTMISSTFFYNALCVTYLQVDRGAVKFVLAGANIMCPGLTSLGGALDDEVEAETPVAIMAGGKQHALAIGFTKMSAKDMRVVF